MKVLVNEKDIGSNPDRDCRTDYELRLWPTPPPKFGTPSSTSPPVQYHPPHSSLTHLFILHSLFVYILLLFFFLYGLILFIAHFLYDIILSHLFNISSAFISCTAGEDLNVNLLSFAQKSVLIRTIIITCQVLK